MADAIRLAWPESLKQGARQIYHVAEYYLASPKTLRATLVRDHLLRLGRDVFRAHFIEADRWGTRAPRFLREAVLLQFEVIKSDGSMYAGYRLYTGDPLKHRGFAAKSLSRGPNNQTITWQPIGAGTTLKRGFYGDYSYGTAWYDAGRRAMTFLPVWPQSAPWPEPYADTNKGSNGQAAIHFNVVRVRAR